MDGGYQQAIRENLPRRRSCSIRSTSCAWPSGPSTRSAATSGTPMSARTPPPGSGSRARELITAQPTPEADARPARQARRSPASQQAALPSLPAQGRLRLRYQLEHPALARYDLDAWLTWASRSCVELFIRLARTIRRHRDGILAAIRLGLDNGRLEVLNNHIGAHQRPELRLFHSASPLIALVYLCCTGISIPPRKRHSPPN